MPGCSIPALQTSAPAPASAPLAQACPSPQIFASWSTFTSETKVVPGETPFETVKRFRLAEKAKNSAGQRLWRGLKQCRDADIPPQSPPPKPSFLSFLLNPSTSQP